jgi:diguanylate cyclase (GGDEF)-like protein
MSLPRCSLQAPRGQTSAGDAAPASPTSPSRRSMSTSRLLWRTACCLARGRNADLFNYRLCATSSTTSLGASFTHADHNPWTTPLSLVQVGTLLFQSGAVKSFETPAFRTATQIRSVHRSVGDIRTNVDQRPIALSASPLRPPSGLPTRELTPQSKRFWISHLRLNYMLLIAETCAVLLYLIRTPHGPHRSLLIITSVLTLGVAVAIVPYLDRVGSSGHGAWFANASILATGAVLTVVLVLDSGLDSPLVGLLVLPITCAALALPLRAVVVCAAATLTEYAIIALLDPTISSDLPQIVMFVALLCGVIALAVGSSLHRTTLQNRQSDLVDELEHLAETDELTACLNHRAFYQRLQSEIDRSVRHHLDLSLVVLDVDLFKSYNDEHGHLDGDAELSSLGWALQQRCRTSDVVARIGGDEFALILPETSLQAAKKFATSVADAVRGEPSVHVTVSMGVAELSPMEPTTARIFRDADAALYVAKSSGRDQVHSASSRSAPFAGARSTNLRSEDRDLLEQQYRDAQQQMLEAVSILDTLQAASPLGLGFVDRETRILRINPALAAITGVPAGELVGRLVREVVPICGRSLHLCTKRSLTLVNP